MIDPEAAALEAAEARLPRVVLVSGERIIRESWEEIEEYLRQRQFQVYPSLEEWRENIVQRALHLTGEELESWGSSLDFLWELSRAQWLEICIPPKVWRRP